jgi:L-asparaginase
MPRPRILILYTGGTIGMIRDADTGALRPFALEAVLEAVPLLGRLGCELNAVEVDEPIDSSDMTPAHWGWLVERIAEARLSYDGFVVMHGSDTMAYTASALSFMLQGLDRPVVLTGSQLPMGLVRTDARENLVTSIMVAMEKRPDGRPRVPEVSVLFEDRLYRGNRTTKVSSSDFEAFRSPNYPALARAGVSIRYDDDVVERDSFGCQWAPSTKMERAVMCLRLFPGIDLGWLPDHVQRHGVRGLVIETYGSGNAQRDPALLHALGTLVEAGVHVINVSQCIHGTVDMTKYDTGLRLMEAGVISGGDMTVEAALTKLMYALANIAAPEVAHFLSVPQRGEANL